MNSRTRIGVLVGILIFVEIPGFHKLSSWLAWTSEPLLAYLMALGFVALLLGSIVVLAHDVPDEFRASVRRGVAALLFVQALANVTISFQHALSTMPVDVFVGLTNLRPDVAVKLTAAIQGGVLSLVSLTFWSVAGLMIRRHEQEQKAKREHLHSVEQLWTKEVAR